MSKIIDNPDFKEWDNLIKRAKIREENLEGLVSSVLKNVENNGDLALKEYTKKFDKLEITNLVDRRSLKDLKIRDSLKSAINRAKKNIETFHLRQKVKNIEVNTEKGVTCSIESRAIESVGLYVPGGTAPLFSSLLMLAIPAKIAGVKNIVVTSPPKKDGEVNDVIRYVASLLKIENVYTVGGAQAIASLAYGTKTIPKVYKIFGPGNSYVNTAKKLVQATGKTAIDLPAGPTELLIIADDFANSNFIATDILSQIEHGKDSQVIVLATSKKLLEESKEKLNLLIKESSRFKILKESVRNCRFILFNDLNTAFKFSNYYAPEHLILALKDAREYKEKIISAGSVFLGNYSAESFGDYASGTNHTLPTDGSARMYSGVNLQSFQKQITFQEISSFGLKNLGNTVIELASSEDLPGHAKAVEVRLASLKNKEIKNTVKLTSLFRKHLKNITPYSSARSEFNAKSATFLDANENSLGSLTKIKLNRYPDPKHKEVREKIAKLNKLDIENVFLGNGSDEIIDLLIRIFCEPETEKIAVLNPSFGMYETQAKINNVKVVKLNLNSDFALRKFDELKDLSIKLFFLCNPNNPSGNSFSLDQIEEVLKDFSNILVVDEAYIEFSKEKSAKDLLKKYKNLVVLRTFSKAFGLAGVRVGYLFGDSKIISVLDKIKAPYNISSLNIEAVNEALDNFNLLSDKVRETLENRDALVEDLKEVEIIEKVFPSDANFLLVKIKEKKKVEKLYKYLVLNQVIIRRRDLELNCEASFRITVGTKSQNKKLISLLNEF